MATQLSLGGTLSVAQKQQPTSQAVPSQGVSIEVRKRVVTNQPLPESGNDGAQTQQYVAKESTVVERRPRSVDSAGGSGDDPSPLLTRKEAAAYLRVSVATLAKWAVQKLPGKVLPVKIGRRAMYVKAELDAYIQRQQQQPVEE